MIGGNVKAIIQIKDSDKQNAIGEYQTVWKDNKCITGFLDLSSGDSKYLPNNAKVQESTHIFICDYVPLDDVTSENSRMIINNQLYDIMLIDDPMKLHQQLEIYLKYVGGQNG